MTVHPSYPLRLPDAVAKAAEYKRLVEDLRQAVELEPRNPYHLILRAKAEAAGDKLEEARSDLDRALQLAPDDPQARLERASILLGERKPKEALPDLDAASHVQEGRLPKSA